jgi:hypothetical protein
MFQQSSRTDREGFSVRNPGTESPRPQTRYIIRAASLSSIMRQIRPPKEMTVRTRREFSSPAGTVWPLLCNSRMEASALPLFKLGVPRPVECRLPDGQGGVGSERECVSDRGVVHQRILAWSPERHLSFRLEQTDLSFQKYVRDMVETFDLAPTSKGVIVTRTTKVWVRGRFSVWKKLLLFLGVKQVQRFVFRNWQQQADLARFSAS